jgi:pimeloyl-ACP methyl ester carboxylesterase
LGRNGVKAVPTWYGAPERPLFGWFHVPDGGTAMGAAVFCQPLGVEGASSLWAVQNASDRLAAQGVAALRFAYSGTGDSAEWLDDPGRLAAWLSDIDETVQLARRATSGPVVLIGLRVGALFALEAAARGTAVDGLALWDPYKAGRAFFRFEKTLLATWYESSQIGDGSVTGPGFTYSPETVQTVSPLTLTPLHAGTLPTAVLVRTSQVGMDETRARFEASGADWMEIEGHDLLFDVPPDMITLPTTSIKTLVDWTTSVVDGPRRPVRFEPVDTAVVGQVEGRPITEHPVWLGPNSLFGMVTEPAEPLPDDAPTMVFLSSGALDHVGPGRRWVELTRRFAAEGIRSIRIDFDGLGETYGRPGQARNIPSPPSAIDDVVDLAAALGDPDASRLVFIGLSSGAYHAIEGALRLHPLAVCAINPGLTGWVAEMDHGPLDPRRQAFKPMAPPFRAFAVKHHRMAHKAWRTLLMVLVHRSPADGLCKVGQRGTPVLLIVTENDVHQFEPSPYWSMVRRRLTKRGLLEVRVVPGSDHSTYTIEGQRDTFPILVDWVVERFGRAGTGHPS